MKKHIKIIIIVGIVVIYLFSVLLYQRTTNKPVFLDRNDRKMTEVDYTNPEKFENSRNESDYVSYNYYGKNISCYYTINIDDYYDYQEGREYLENNVSVLLSDKVSEIKEDNINGSIWYSMNVESKGKYTTYYYVTCRGEKTYELEYRIYDYERGDYEEGDDDNYCKTSLDELVASLKIK